MQMPILVFLVTITHTINIAVFLREKKKQQQPHLRSFNVTKWKVNRLQLTLLRYSKIAVTSASDIF